MKNKTKQDKKERIYAIIYARVATDGEVSQTAVERQLIDCRKFARARGYVLEKDSEYSETYTGIGKWEHRPGLTEILQHTDKHPERVFVLIVNDISRIGREYEQYESYRASLASRGVSIESVKGSFDDNPVETLKRELRYSMARYEQNMRHNRAVEAIRKNKKI